MIALLLAALLWLLATISRHSSRFPAPRRPAAAVTTKQQTTAQQAKPANDGHMHCRRAVLEDVSLAALAVVITWSPSSRGSGGAGRHENIHGSKSLAQLVAALSWRPSVRAVVDAKGARCSTMPPPLMSWAVDYKRAHCIEGPNMGSREAHTVLRFCLMFYDHLPAAIMFTQDDPDVHLMEKVGAFSQMDTWLDAVHRAHASRVELAAAEAEARTHPAAALATRAYANRTTAAGSTMRPVQSSPDTPMWARVPWVMEPCPCWVEYERAIGEASYGHARSVLWWLRTFVNRPAAGLPAGSPGLGPPLGLPSTLVWPQHAQFVVTARAIRARSRRFYELNLGMASMPSPLRAAAPDGGVPPPNMHCLAYRCRSWRRWNRNRLGRRLPPGCNETNDGPCTQTWAERAQKWANFGPYVVGLGPLSPSDVDQRRSMHANDVANLFERLWFLIFDPAVEVQLPPPVEQLCYTEVAVLEGELRCGRACARRPPPSSPPVKAGGSAGSGGQGWADAISGCPYTDRLGLTDPNPHPNPNPHPAAHPSPMPYRLSHGLGSASIGQDPHGFLAASFTDLAPRHQPNAAAAAAAAADATAADGAESSTNGSSSSSSRAGSGRSSGHDGGRSRCVSPGCLDIEPLLLARGQGAGGRGQEPLLFARGVAVAAAGGSGGSSASEPRPQPASEQRSALGISLSAAWVRDFLNRGGAEGEHVTLSAGDAGAATPLELELAPLADESTALGWHGSGSGDTAGAVAVAPPPALIRLERVRSVDVCRTLGCREPGRVYHTRWRSPLGQCGLSAAAAPQRLPPRPDA